MNYVGIKHAMLNAQLPVPIPSTGTLRNYAHRAGDMAAVQPFNVLSLRTIVRAHSAVPEDEHQTFVVSNGDTIPDDGSFAAIAVSTPALLRNVSATHLHRGCSYIQCDSDRHLTACGWNSAVACTTDFNHRVLPAAFALGTHENEHLFTAAGQGVAKTLQEGVLNVLQTDCAIAIQNGINWAGAAIDTDIT